MGQTCILTGMIIKAAPAGEYDKRITLLTRERGKVTAFARGARRPKSAMQAATNLFCFGKFEAYEGREAYTVVRADIQEYFSWLYTDPDRMYYGCYFLELADYFIQPYSEGVQQLSLLYQTVRALGVQSLEPRLVRRIYELKTLVYYGVAPQVFACVKCGKKEGLVSFYIENRGVLCGSCAERLNGIAPDDGDRQSRIAPDDTCRSGKIALDEASLYTLQYIISSSVGKLYTFKVTETVYRTVSEVIGRYLRLYVDRELKTLAFLPHGE
ncbi:MAG: DNA repair protein RecO [Lachnospiraceae bacterium]|nr:DNA repair protein RecO [Lachnospiraceae bacterium]